MKRTFTRFVVFSVAILSAELVVQYLNSMVPRYRVPWHPYGTTLLRMGFIIAVFYPCFLVCEAVMERFVKFYVRKSKKLTTGWWRGMITCFTIALLLLLWGFAKVWYGRNLFADAWNTLAGLF